MHRSLTRLLLVCTYCLTVSGVFSAVAHGNEHADAAGAEPPLAEYFGFEPLEIIRIGRNAGPIAVADMNGNGRNDLVVANNRASRIELHLQRSDASPDDPVSAPRRVNELPEHWRYERSNVSVAHRVSAIVPHDFDGDGLMDLIYAGQPAELVFMRQSEPGQFQVASRHRTRGLSTSRHALAIAPLLGRDTPDLIAIVGGEIHIFPIEGDDLGSPVRLAAGNDISRFLIEDFNGNGKLDVVAMVADSSAPIRAWFNEGASRSEIAAATPGTTAGTAANPKNQNPLNTLGPQHRFEMPTLRTIEAVRLPHDDGAQLAVIEQSSRRLITYRFARESVAGGDAAYEVHSFTDPQSRRRETIVADLDGNGMLDIVATDSRANAVVVYRQKEGVGLLPPVSYPSLSDVDGLVIAHLDDVNENREVRNKERGSSGLSTRHAATLFVVSEEEGVVGRSEVTDEGISFPRPLAISPGHSPVAIELIRLAGKPHLAVVAKSNRDHVVDVLDLEGGRETIELGTMSRSPETIIALDADQDGRTDLLLFSPRDRSMTMLHATEDGFDVLESRDMGQFGLVQSARMENTAVFDVDGNGHDELLIADRNFIRALRYVPEPEPGESAGWQVIAQINADDPSAQLSSLAVMGGRLVAADTENDRLLIIDREVDADDVATGGWGVVESVGIRGFNFSQIHAGPFSGGDSENVVAIGSDGFAVIHTDGERIALLETNAWRSENEDQLHHLFVSGDINSDGFTDLVAFDAGEQMCDIFTFTSSGKMLYALGFKTYESRIFTGGRAREYQPAQALIEDVTGNGAVDLVMLIHDRVMIYPQMVHPEE